MKIFAHIEKWPAAKLTASGPALLKNFLSTGSKRIPNVLELIRMLIIQTSMTKTKLFHSRIDLISF